MTIEELENIMNSGKRITFGFIDKNYIIETEKLFIEGGYNWLDRDKGYFILRNHIDNIKTLILFIDYDSIGDKTLSYISNSSVSTIVSIINIIITQEIYKLLCEYFKKIPSYKSKKFIREI
jgi:hypothetical protein